MTDAQNDVEMQIEEEAEDEEEAEMLRKAMEMSMQPTVQETKKEEEKQDDGGDVVDQEFLGELMDEYGVNLEADEVDECLNEGNKSEKKDDKKD